MGILEKVTSQETRDKLALITPFIIEASKKHWNDLNYFPETFIEKSKIIHTHVAGVLNNFGNSQLTSRERDSHTDDQRILSQSDVRYSRHSNGYHQSTL